MKILHIIGNMGSGGAEKLLLDTLPLYNENGLSCDLLVFNGEEFPFMKKLKETRRCNIYSLGMGSIYNPLLIFKIIPYLKKYDIAHVHLFPAQYWVVFAKILGFCKIKLVLTEHSFTNDRMEIPILNFFDKIIYRFYQKTICISEKIFKKFIAYTKVKRNKIELIHNGVSLDEIYEAKPYNKNEISTFLNSEDIVLIQVARFNKYKDHKTIIKSLTHLPNNFKLLLVGEGETKVENQKLVKILNLEKRVVFLGLRMDVPNLLKSADISILSSHSEGFGLAAVEGMASGKPFIGSNVEGLSDVVSDGGLLFERGNDLQLAKIILNLSYDSDLYLKTTENCRERAKQFDINKMVEKHINLYKSIL